MKFALALGQMKGDLSATRPSNPSVRLLRRFGDTVRVNPAVGTRPAYFTGFTPTQEDLDADDWIVVDADGNPVPEPVSVSDPDRPVGQARGGTGAGTGWRRA